MTLKIIAMQCECKDSSPFTAVFTGISMASATRGAYPRRMFARFRWLRHAFAIIPACAVLLSTDTAMAQTRGVSDWSDSGYAMARLVAGGAKQGSNAAVLRAGLEIALKPGWKTYWRYPGDSGTPPRVNFARSDNVKAVTMLWPAPMRFDDGSGGTSIGYKVNVVFPLHVTRTDPTKPAILRADVDYAICEKLCVPAEAKLEIPLAPSPASESTALDENEAHVPHHATLGAPGPLAITKIQRLSEPKPHVVVDVAAPAGAKVDLLAEGPNAEWALPLPQPIEGGPAGTQRFAFDLEGIPAGASVAGATLTLTAASGSHAIEVAAPLN
jgi:DsbC/DsbD-like thiol-disulfide interchange protein